MVFLSWGDIWSLPQPNISIKRRGRETEKLAAFAVTGMADKNFLEERDLNREGRREYEEMSIEL